MANEASGLLRTVQERWPQLVADAPALGAALDALAAEQGPPTPEQAYLVARALACAKGDSAALRSFEDEYFGPARREVMRLVGERDGDEIMQKLRERLFLPVGEEPPRVVRAAGRGDMGKLVRVAALRLALNARRGDDRRRRRHQEAELHSLGPVLDDPELRAMKAAHVEALKIAFEQAVESLTSRERNLLRHHLIDHLSIDELAARYGVHRATAARWLARARAEVAERTRVRLAALLDADTSPEELRELVQSRLDLSVTRVLAITRAAR